MLDEEPFINLTDAMIDDFNRTSILDLSGNSFVCNDEKIVRFYQLAKHRTVVGWSNGTGYNCTNDNGESKTFLQIVQNGEEERDGCCPATKTTSSPDKKTMQTIVMVAIVAGISVVVFGAVVTYYTRSNMWYIKYRLAKRRLHKNYEMKADNSYVIYDAFVSYSNDDQKWVYEELSPYLENEIGLKLCLHERDFSAGLPIVENIVQSLEQSRCCLIILSEGYASSEWCNFELNCAQQIFSEENRSIVVIVLEEPSAEKLTKTMRHTLQTQTYLEWKREKSMDQINSNFWKRLSHTISTTNSNKIYTCKT